MTRFTIAICTGWIALAGITLSGIAAAQSPTDSSVWGEGTSTPVKSVAAPASINVEAVPTATPPVPPPIAGSPGEAQTSREARAHEEHLLLAQAQAESVHRAAMARFEQRTRRLESQRWFGISNSRPTASIDPYDGDYSPGWVSNYPFYPYRWIGSGDAWGFVEGQ